MWPPSGQGTHKGCPRTSRSSGLFAGMPRRRSISAASAPVVSAARRELSSPTRTRSCALGAARPASASEGGGVDRERRPQAPRQRAAAAPQAAAAMARGRLPLRSQNQAPSPPRISAKTAPPQGTRPESAAMSAVWPEVGPWLSRAGAVGAASIRLGAVREPARSMLVRTSAIFQPPWSTSLRMRVSSRPDA